MTEGRKESRGQTQAREIVFSCLCSFALLLFCTRSSPLYAFNNWDDVNSYFSMGKGMMNGMVPYRDLFDQKGILLYFLYGLGYLLSHTSFIGVFLIEVIAAALHLWAALKISLLLAGERETGRRLCWLFLPLYGACVYSARCVWYGGSAEELMLPLFAWGLWLLLRVLRVGEASAGGRTDGDKIEKTNDTIITRAVFAAGVLAGCVLHIKFNSLGFFFGWIASVIILRMKRDGVLRSILRGVWFLGGMGAATLPWLLYFLANGAVRDWYRVTIWLNLFVYSEKLPLGERLYVMAKTLYTHFLDNPAVFVPAALGVLWFLLSRRFRAGEKLAVVATGFFLALGIFIGGVSLPYYPLPLTVYALFAVPAAASLLSGVFAVVSRASGGESRGRWSVVGYALGAALVVVCSAAVIGKHSLNPSFLGTRKDALWQYRFAEDIAVSGVEDPTLLNMNCFDVGLYCLADIVPNCYFFQTQTIHLDDVYLMQRENLRRGDTEFVVAMGGYPDGIGEHYEQIDEASAEHFGETHVYLLFQKREENR